MLIIKLTFTRHRHRWSTDDFENYFEAKMKENFSNITFCHGDGDSKRAIVIRNHFRLNLTACWVQGIRIHGSGYPTFQGLG